MEIKSSNPQHTNSSEFIGRVVFYPEVGTEFLFFHPNFSTPLLRALKNSMWFEKNNKTYGTIYRASASLEALEWLKSAVGAFSISSAVHTWLSQQVAIPTLQFPDDSPLYPFQKEAISFLTSRKKAMLSLSPGLGKTIVSSYAAGLLPAQNVLVVAPASLLYMWVAELEKWQEDLPKLPVTHVWHRKIDKSNLAKPADGSTNWIITNPETVNNSLPAFLSCNFDLIILDESILYKNRKAKRTAKLSTLSNSVDRTWLLTGAPATRMLDDLWSQFHILNPKAYSSYWRFAKEYCIVDETPWGSKVAANKLHAEDDIKRNFRDIYLARSQDEVLDIPDWLFETIDSPMTTEQQRIYHDLKIDLRSALSQEDPSSYVTVNNHLSLVIRLLQAASNPLLIGGKDTSGKWEIIPGLLDLYPAPFIFWTSYIQSAKSIQAMLTAQGLKSSFMLGETVPEERQKLVDKFQTGKLDAIVLGQAVGSFGLTLTAGRTAFYVERNFDGSYFQSLHRFRRIGTTQRPVVIHMRSVYQDGKKTIDHVVDRMLSYRVGMIQSLTVGMFGDI